MQDPSDSMEIAEPEENGRSDTTDSPAEDAPTSDSDSDSTTTSTVLVEVLPGVAIVGGEVPPELKPDLIDFGIVPAADRKQISAILASIGRYINRAAWRSGYNGMDVDAYQVRGGGSRVPVDARPDHSARRLENGCSGASVGSVAKRRVRTRVLL
ncbi:hypothetical protein [Saccharothrix sp. NRRL B-16314]|uniref:hypothetical protein n=1 Tax=Saccharothrix sp. NRRL B-16314 TaxID=1463825 RepID=UPI00052722ED|nr:hypothetical protein [Saccharothrix sp. NRRL B-16314]